MYDKEPEKTKPHGNSRVSNIILLVAAVLTIVLGGYALTQIGVEPTREANPIGNRPTTPEMLAVAGPVAEKSAAVETATADAEDKLQEASRDKLCTSIAETFLTAETQTDLQRQLILYNLNRCDNQYMRNAGIKGRGLTDAESRSIMSDTETGQITIEDR